MKAVALTVVSPWGGGKGSLGAQMGEALLAMLRLLSLPGTAYLTELL